MKPMSHWSLRSKEPSMVKGLVGLIRHQDEIYVSLEAHDYVHLAVNPGDDDEQCVSVHVTNIDALISLLVAAKRGLQGNQG